MNRTDRDARALFSRNKQTKHHRDNALFSGDRARTVVSDESSIYANTLMEQAKEETSMWSNVHCFPIWTRFK